MLQCPVNTSQAAVAAKDFHRFEHAKTNRLAGYGHTQGVDDLTDLGVLCFQPGFQMGFEMFRPEGRDIGQYFPLAA